VYKKNHGVCIGYATIWSAHPQCAAGTKSIFETDAAATLAEWSYCEL